MIGEGLNIGRVNDHGILTLPVEGPNIHKYYIRDNLLLTFYLESIKIFYMD
jgi:hypothetical protein